MSSFSLIIIIIIIIGGSPPPLREEAEEKYLCREDARARRLDSKKRGVRRGIEAKAYVLRNVGDLNRDHLESGEGGNGLDIPQVLRLTGAKSVVGLCVPSSAVNLAVGVATVSSAHAMVDLTPDGKVMVTDLTSTNGTYIDGEELLPGIPQELTEGREVILRRALREVRVGD